MFEPIAIVGRACVLPQSPDPTTFAAHLRAGRSLITQPPPGRWRVAMDRALGDGLDRARVAHGAYVTQEVAPPQEGLDEVFAWASHVARGALDDAQIEAPCDGERVGAIWGHLSFPTEAMSRWVERGWLDQLPEAWRDRAGVIAPDARARFMSGLPFRLVARELGLRGEVFALDAACASSLYALGLACAELHARRADVMLAGAVQIADALFLHMGFSALQAISPSGQSRPFHPQADGLIPAEGAACVALRRLDDALERGDQIYGVIRGVGLSNDGRARGFLAPSSSGQVRAIRQAYARAGLDPLSVSYVECHATGTTLGDATELGSVAEVWGEGASVRVGSHKSNMGHAMTVAGMAGLLKLMADLADGEHSPTIHLDAGDGVPEALRDRIEVVREVTPWTAREGVRRAGLSAFGFGGNNAHVILDAFDEYAAWAPAPPASTRPEPPLAIIGLGVIHGDAADTDAFYRGVVRGDQALGRAVEAISLELDGLRVPPADLQQTLMQHLLILGAAREATRGLALDGARAGALIGMQCDPTVASFGARWRIEDWALEQDLADEEAATWAADARDVVLPALRSPGVLGTMPNIPANRLNLMFDLQGPSFTVSDDEASGLAACHAAAHLLRTGALDVALVGAVDVATHPDHERAAREVFGEAWAEGADAAVVWVMCRLEDAEADGQPILATLREGVEPEAAGVVWRVDPAADLTRWPSRAGCAHAARGALEIAAAILASATGELPPEDQRRREAWEASGRRIIVQVPGPGKGRLSWTVAPGTAPWTPKPLPDGARTMRFTGLRDGRAQRLDLPEPPAVADPIEAPTPDSPDSPAQPVTPEPPAAPVAAAQDGASEMTTTPHSPSPQPPAQHMRRAPAVPSAREGFTPLASRPERQVDTRPDAPPVNTTHHVSRETHAPESPAHDPALEAMRGFQDELWRAQARFIEDQQAALDALMQHQLRGQAILQQAFTAYSDAPTAQPAEPTPTPAPEPEPVVQPPRHEAPPVFAPNALTPTPELGIPAAPQRPPEPIPTRETTSPGPWLTREDLEYLSHGQISRHFGPKFAPQDGYAVQTRMPEPPLLLADRVMRIEAEPASMSTGTIWTETDVTWDDWYLVDGRMPAGIMIESGQADLLLASYLGVDLYNRGERAYRLLGCELTYHGELPKVGETLEYEIVIDQFASQGDVRLFFFHYDCKVGGELRLSVRGGQAGFFTREELDDSKGVLWSAVDGEHDPDAPVCAPRVVCQRRSFDRAQVDAFARGDTYACFGPGFELAQTHNRSPRIAHSNLLMVDRVTHFEPGGGPWKKGYLRAEADVAPDDWFFPGHFHNDPCMPGTLMFQACLDLMGFYMAGMGLTLAHDGWRFEPISGEPYAMRCRGQIIPSSRRAIYEIFIEEVTDGERPRIFADLLVTVDGLKAFHCRRMGVELVPDVPMAALPVLPEPDVPCSLIAPPLEHARPRSLSPLVWHPTPTRLPERAHDPSYPSILSLAWGRHSDAFGPAFAAFDGARKAAHMPGPPYLFMSRVVDVDQPCDQLRSGVTAIIDYEVPESAWYFDDNGAACMPYGVLMEVALQPCGWLSTWVGSMNRSETTLHYRNLDGRATLKAPIVPGMGPLRTITTMTSSARSGGMILQTFDVRVWHEDEVLYELQTGFGFFPAEALANQVGLTREAGAWDALSAPCEGFEPVVLGRGEAKPARGGDRPELASGRLLMLDRVTGYWPQAGRAGLGRWRAEVDVDPSDWFFKAHFYEDPVQPGSLGVEAMVQLLQFVMIYEGWASHEGAQFAPVLLDDEHVWKYRGQVVPTNRLVTIELEVVEVRSDDEGVLAIADAWLWVDGRCIYAAERLGMRTVSGLGR